MIEKNTNKKFDLWAFAKLEEYILKRYGFSDEKIKEITDLLGCSNENNTQK